MILDGSVMAAKIFTPGKAVRNLRELIGLLPEKYLPAPKL